MNLEVEYKIQQEIARFNYEYGMRESKLKALQQLNHGHKFDHNWLCICGLREVQYYKTFRDDINHHCCLRTLEDMQKEYNVLVSI